MPGYQNVVSGEDVYQGIKEDILTLRLKPGQMISENEIASSYHVSRTPVKTAFLRLKGEKYIEIVPQKGSFVTLLDIKYIRDIIYMRSVLEMDMLYAILEKDEGEKAAVILEENLDRQMNLIKSGDVNPSAFYNVDSVFHYSLFQCAGRGKMWDVIQDCQVYYTRFRILDTASTARYHELYREHVSIVGAMKSRDRSRLKTCVFDHLHGSLRVLASKIEGEYKDYFIQQ